MRRVLLLTAAGVIGLGARDHQFSYKIPAKELFILPTGYRGPFIAIYGDTTGVEPSWRADTAVFEVPARGILRVKYEEPPHSTKVSHVFADKPDKWIANVPTCADMRAYVTDTIPRLCWMDYSFGRTGTPKHIVAVVTDWAGIPKNFERTSFVYDSLLHNGDGKTIRKWEEPPELIRKSRSGSGLGYR